MSKFNLDRVMFALPPLLWQDADVKLRLKEMKKRRRGHRRVLCFYF
nr:hypothetical protein [uncultured Campylobacter sp.]